MEGSGGGLAGIGTVATTLWSQVSQVVTTVTTSGNEMMLIGVTTVMVGSAVGIFKSLVGLRRRRR